MVKAAHPIPVLNGNGNNQVCIYVCSIRVGIILTRVISLQNVFYGVYSRKTDGVIMDITPRALCYPA